MGLLDLSNVTAGSKIDVVIDVSTSGRQVTRYIGASWGRLINPDGLPYNNSGVLSLSQNQIDLIKSMRLDMIRFVGLIEDLAVMGSLSGAIDAALVAADAIGIPPSGVIICPNSIYSDTALSLSQWQSLVSYGKTVGIKHWEIDNEPYNRYWKSYTPYSRYTTAQAADYISYVNSIAAAIKSEQPDAVVIAPVYGIDPSSSWGTPIITSTSANVDVYSGHWSDRNSLYSSSLPTMLNANPYTVTRLMQQVLGQANSLGKQIWDTGWSMLSPSTLTTTASTHYHSEPQFASRNGNMYGVLGRAVHMIYRLSEIGPEASLTLGVTDRLQCEHGVDSLGLLLVPSSGSGLGMLYWLQRVLGEDILTGRTLYWSGVVPLSTAQDSWTNTVISVATPLVALMGNDTVTILVANPTSVAYPAKFTLVGFGINSAKATALKAASLDASPLLPDQTGTGLVSSLDVSIDPRYVELTVPEYSVVSIVLTRISHYNFSGISTDELYRISNNLQRGIGDLDDLKVQLRVDDGLVLSDRPVADIEVHTGSYFFTPVEEYFQVDPRSDGFVLPKGISVYTLSAQPRGSTPVVVEDNRGRFMHVNNNARLMTTVPLYLVPDSDSLWRGTVPGHLLDVHNASRQTMYRVTSLDQLTENSYYYDETTRTLTVKTPECYVDYVPDEPDIVLEEYAYCYDGLTIRSRHVPEIGYSMAIHVDTWKAYQPGNRDMSLWQFNESIPIGKYLLRYVRNRSFCVDGTTIKFFTTEPTSVRVSYDIATVDWKTVKSQVDIGKPYPLYVALTRSLSPGDTPEELGMVPSNMNVLYPNYSTTQDWPHPVTLTCHVISSDGRGVPNVSVRWNGDPALVDYPVKETNEAGIVHFQLTASGEVTGTVSVPHWNITKSVRIPVAQQVSERPAIVYAFRSRRIQDESDAIYIYVVSPLGEILSEYEATLIARSGWLSTSSTPKSEEKQTVIRTTSLKRRKDKWVKLYCSKEPVQLVMLVDVRNVGNVMYYREV